MLIGFSLGGWDQWLLSMVATSSPKTHDTKWRDDSVTMYLWTTDTITHLKCFLKIKKKKKKKKL
jgi:hypothetical protein